MNPPEFYQDNNVITLSERIHRDQTLDNVVLSYDALSSDPEIAALFDLPSDTPLIHYRRMRIINQRPTIIEETRMPRALFPAFTEENCRQSVLHYIEQTCGYAISHDVKSGRGKYSMQMRRGYYVYRKDKSACVLSTKSICKAASWHSTPRKRWQPIA